MATTDEAGGTGSEPVALGEDVAWTDIHPDGTEEERTGREWGPAPPLQGMKAWWVIPDRFDGEPGSGAAVLVCRSSRRHLAGREVEREALGTVRRRYVPGAGRYVDKGEYFRETDPRSRFAQRYVPPTHAVLPHPDAAGQTDLMLFERLCLNVAAGLDVDMSVGMPDER